MKLLAALALGTFVGNGLPTANAHAPLAPVAPRPVVYSPLIDPCTPTVGNQLKSWFFSPTRIDFASGTATAVTVAGAVNSPYLATAAAYDGQNNLLFYVAAGAPFTVYDANNTFVSALNGVTMDNGDPLGGSMAEVAVVPIPGVCRQYYLFYTMGGPFGGAVCYAKVSCPVGGPVAVTTNTTILDPTYRIRTSIAVSKPRPDGTRILYDVSDVGIHYITLNVGGGFSAINSVVGSALPYQAYRELDISPDGLRMAWTMSDYQNGSKAFVVDIDQINGAPDMLSLRTYNAANNSVGIEFSGNSKKLYVAASGSISVADLTASTTTLATVANTSDADLTQLETAYDGLVYYVNTSGRLKSINPCTDAVALSPVTTVLSKTSSPLIVPSVYTLPDQLDGENYALQPSNVTPAINFARVDNQLLNPNSVRNVYNCNPLALTFTSITGAAAVQVTLTPTNSAGVITGSAVCSTGWLPAPPAEIKSMCGAYLANGANAGYYQLKIEARSDCGQITTLNGRIQVSSLTAASAGFQFNPCNGNLVDPLTTSQASPLVVGVYSGGVNLNFSTGVATSYQIKFEQFDSGTSGAMPIGNTIDEPGPPSGSVSFSFLANQAGLAANYFTPLGAGYDKIHRITLTITNQCGTTTPLTGYFIPSNINCRPTATPGPDKPSVSLYPNPLGTGTGHLSFTLPTAQRVSLVIVDGLTGQEKLVLLRDADRPAGPQTVEFNTTGLAKGVYLYRLITDEVQVGRLLKTE